MQLTASYHFQQMPPGLDCHRDTAMLTQQIPNTMKPKVYHSHAVGQGLSLQHGGTGEAGHPAAQLKSRPKSFLIPYT